MKRILFLVAILATLTTAVGDVAANKLNLAQLKNISQRYRFAMEVGTPGSEDHKFVYANNRNRLFVYKIKSDGLELDWENSNMGSRVTGMIIGDLYGDGVTRLVTGSVRGRVMIYDFTNYDLEYENIQGEYTIINHMAAANLDDDPQKEIVILANDLMFIFDSFNRKYPVAEHGAV